MGAPTPILTAVYRGRTEEPAALLAQRPALTLFEAAAIGDVEAIGAALRAAEAAALAGRSPDSWPALYLAAYFGCAEAVDALIAAGADVCALSDSEERNTDPGRRGRLPDHAARAPGDGGG